FSPLQVAIELAAFPAEQVKKTIVVVVAPDGRPAHPAHIPEAFASFVVPNLAPAAHVHPAVLVEAAPSRPSSLVRLQAHGLGADEKRFDWFPGTQGGGRQGHPDDHEGIPANERRQGHEMLLAAGPKDKGPATEILRDSSHPTWQPCRLLLRVV